MKNDIAFLGAGNMGEAIALALIQSKRVSPDRVVVFDPDPQRRNYFESESINVASSNTEAAQNASTVFLCVKPQKMNDVLTELAGVLNAKQLVISIAAGISTTFIESRVVGGVRVIRAMPNTPLMAGYGATALCRGKNATVDDLHAARELFESAGIVVDVDETLMDAVTAVSGSGPAYFFYLAEHMIAAATNLGLTEVQAATLVRQTAVGAAAMLSSNNDPAAKKRRVQVTSPGGTTAAAIEHFESHGVGRTIEEAIAAAQKRGRELGK